jgi:hypothetical protein
MTTTSSIERLKGVLVSACQSNKDGHADIFSNLMELAGEIVEEMDPEDIEAHIFPGVDVEKEDGLFYDANTTDDDTDEDSSGDEEFYSADDYDNEVEKSSSGSSLASILARVGRPTNSAKV